MTWKLQSYPTTVLNERMLHFRGKTYSDPSYIFSGVKNPLASQDLRPWHTVNQPVILETARETIHRHRQNEKALGETSYRGNRPTNKHSHKPTNRQDRLQYTAPLSLARSVNRQLHTYYNSTVNLVCIASSIDRQYALNRMTQFNRVMCVWVKARQLQIK